MRVEAHRLRVFAWHWGYNTFDINAYVDGRREAFDAVSVLPSRGAYPARYARLSTKFHKPGDIVYDEGRFIDDTRSVPLWSVEKGWADLDTDWEQIGKEIAVRTGPWVKLLADAVSECLGKSRK